MQSSIKWATGIEVDSMGLAAQPQGLQRNRPTAGKRIENLRRIAFSPRMQELVGGGNQLPGRVDVLGVVRVLPAD